MDSKDYLQKSRLMRLGFLSNQTKQELIQPVTSGSLVEVISTGEKVPEKTKISPSLQNSRIRFLVEAGADWQAIRHELNLLIKTAQTKEDYAFIIETARAKGLMAGLMDVLQSPIIQSLSSDQAYYFFLSSTVRDAILEGYVAGKKLPEIIETNLLAHQDQQILSTNERLFCFQKMMSMADDVATFSYLQFYDTEFQKKFQNNTVRHLGWNRDQFLLAAGQVAGKIGYEEDAREYFAQISANCFEHQLALELMLLFSRHQTKTTYSTYPDELKKVETERERAHLLNHYILTSKRLGGLKDRHRPTLNQILAQISVFFPKEPDSFRSVSRVLSNHADCYNILPNVLSFFFENQNVFFPPELDLAIWLDIANAESEMDRKNPMFSYLRGIALLHKYIGQCGVNDKDLWLAESLLSNFESQNENCRKWKDLFRQAVTHVTHAQYFTHGDRIRTLTALRMAAGIEFATLQNISEYLDRSFSVPLQVLQQFQKSAVEQSNFDLQVSLLLKKANDYHLTNSEFGQLYELSCAAKDDDLAWRCLTILESRKALKTEHQQAWKISGEKRQLGQVQFQYWDHKKYLFDICTAGLEPDQKKFVIAFFHLHKNLGELLAFAGSHFTSQRFSLKKLQKNAEGFAHLTSNQNFIDGYIRYQIPDEALYFDQVGIPTFVHGRVEDNWIILLCLLRDFFGFYFFDDDAGILSEKISAIDTQISSHFAKSQKLTINEKISFRLGRIFSEMAADERIQWQILTATLKNNDATELTHSLLQTLIKLCLVLYPQHELALSGLRRTQVPIGLIWKLEGFVISQPYSAWRKKTKQQNRVQIPTFLRRVNPI